jgi:hypothetical protein
MITGKQSLPKQPNASEPVSSSWLLTSVGAKFDLLKAELRLLDQLCAQIRDNGHWTDNLETHWEMQRERLLDAMHEIATAAITQSAVNADQLAIKARILLDYCTPEGGDVPDLLGASICNDILAAQFNPLGSRAASTQNNQLHSIS